METVRFYKKEFQENEIIISRIQIFIWKYLSNKNHPEWFNEVLFDMKSNAIIPIPKIIFDEDHFNNQIERLEYAQEQIQLAIIQLNKISPDDFFKYILYECKNLFCEISDSEFPLSKDVYENYYIKTLNNIIILLN